MPVQIDYNVHEKLEVVPISTDENENTECQGDYNLLIVFPLTLQTACFYNAYAKARAPQYFMENQQNF